MGKFYEFLKKHFPIKRRFVTIVMIFWSLFNCYLQKTSIPITVVAMCNPLRNDNSFSWTHRQQTLILAAFNWTYPILQLPGAMLANRWGGRRVLGFTGTSVGIMALLSPTIISLGGYKAFIGLRTLTGLLEGITTPVALSLISKWAPTNELSLLSSIANSGAILGMMTSNIFAGWFIVYMGEWRSIFYVYGSITMMWILLWMMLVFDDPIDHPYITDEEREMIHEEQEQTVSQEHGKVPFKIMFKSAAVWALIISECGNDYSIFIFSTMYPKFVNDVAHYNLRKNGLFSSLPYLCMWIVAMTSGWITDFVLNHTKVSLTAMRKINNTVGIVGNAGLILIAFYIADYDIIVFTFIAAMAFRGLYYTSIKINMMDIAPNFTGVLAGVSNALGSIMGIAAPTVNYILIPNSSFEEWRIVFWIATGVMITSAVVFLIFGSGEVQWWNNGVDAEGRPLPPPAENN